MVDFMGEVNIPILLVDSDGFIEGLSEWMYDAGVNAMYPFEVQAGNDLTRVKENTPNMAAIGGLNKNCMADGRDAIDRELSKVEGLIRAGRFIPGPDHFVLSDVTYANYSYFMRNLKEIILSMK